MKCKITKSPICIGVINIHNPNCTKFLPENFKRFIANQLQDREIKDVNLLMDEKLINDCGNRLIFWYIVANKHLCITVIVMMMVVECYLITSLNNKLVIDHTT